jgi:DNA polymerase I
VVLAPQLAADPPLAALARDVELPLAEVLAKIEVVGIRLDVTALSDLGSAMDLEITALQAELDAAAGHPLNVGSPKQLQEFLYVTLGLEPEKKRKIKTGFSTDATTLKELAADHPVAGKILEHRGLTKLKSTYIEILPRLVDKKTGRVHTVFNQAVAATGRLSSESPNLQNIPIRTELGKKIRRAFIADPGNLLVSADYSQIELRVVAHLASDAALIDAFNDPRGIDVHTRTAAEVFQVPESAVTSEQRRIAKAVNYAVMYGQSDFGLAQVINVERAEARRYIERYFATFSGVRDYMLKVIVDARTLGYSTTLLGRKRPLPDLRSPSFQARAGAERMARNTPIQGSAADILKLAMIAMQRRLDHDAEAGGPLAGARMLLTVHDELVFEVAAERADALLEAARHEMVGVVALKVPLKVDAAKGATWADIH